MKAALDTSAINWLADNPGTDAWLSELRAARVVEVLVLPEVAAEIRNTKEPVRRALLEAVLSRFFPLTPTRLPRFGTARSGLALYATDTDEARLASVGFLKDSPDQHHATNAAGYRCDVFVARDGELTHDKVKELEAQLGQTRVITPEQFFIELEQQRANAPSERVS